MNTLYYYKRTMLILVMTALIGLHCGNPAHEEAEGEGTETVETEAYTSEEEFTDLIDEEMSKWRNFKTDTISDLWKVADGVLELEGRGGGDIVTRDTYQNFDLELEWKISEGGNSGLFFHVIEQEDLGAVWHSGPEFQLLDNERHKDAQIAMHRAGDNYDLHSSSEEPVKPAEEWNSSRLVVNEGQVAHYMNGIKVVEYQLGDEDWTERYEKSKFADKPMYGQAGSGHIALQDHGDKVWFRNIRIKKL